MKTDKMNVRTFVTNCIDLEIEFEITHYEREAYDEYCVHLILGNNEYIVPTRDEYKLAKIWAKILEYYIY